SSRTLGFFRSPSLRSGAARALPSLLLLRRRGRSASSAHRRFAPGPLGPFPRCSSSVVADARLLPLTVASLRGRSGPSLAAPPPSSRTLGFFRSPSLRSGAARALPSL